KCDGVSPACPADGQAQAGTACTSDSNPCTDDQCDGTSVTCQHPAGGAGKVCRAAAGECDLTETCSGSSTACPADTLKSNGASCTADALPCTADICNGTSVNCTHPAGNAGTVCRPAVAECDLPESCNGGATDCPTDAVKPSGTACTDDGNVCTL